MATKPKKTLDDMIQETTEATNSDNEDVTLDGTSIPDWMPMPPDFTVPPGKQLRCLRFRGKNTDRVDKGDRTCGLWNLTTADEDRAIERARSKNEIKVTRELAKQQIRIIDGLKADWSGTPGPANIHTFWEEIGAAHRLQIINVYNKFHALQGEDLTDFLVNGIAVVTSVG